MALVAPPAALCGASVAPPLRPRPRPALPRSGVARRPRLRSPLVPPGSRRPRRRAPWQPWPWAWAAIRRGPVEPHPRPAPIFGCAHPRRTREDDDGWASEDSASSPLNPPPPRISRRTGFVSRQIAGEAIPVEARPRLTDPDVGLKVTSPGIGRSKETKSLRSPDPIVESFGGVRGAANRGGRSRPPTARLPRGRHGAPKRAADGFSTGAARIEVTSAGFASRRTTRPQTRRPLAFRPRTRCPPGRKRVGTSNEAACRRARRPPTR